MQIFKRLVTMESVIFIADRQLNRIKKDVRRSQQSAYAEGTFDNLNTQWVKYIAFCLYYRLGALPASTATLVWYVQFLSKGLKSHSSLISYLSGVKKLHTFLGFSTTGFSGIALKLTLMGLRRLNPHVPRWVLRYRSN